MPELDGYIFAFHEQGMSEVWDAFQDRAHCHVTPDGRETWDRAGLWRVEPGDWLQIRDAEGGIVWEGVVARRLSRFGRFAAAIAGRSEPEPVERWLWDHWFNHHPKYAARYRPARAQR